MVEKETGEEEDIRKQRMREEKEEKGKGTVMEKEKLGGCNSNIAEAANNKQQGELSNKKRSGGVFSPGRCSHFCIHRVERFYIKIPGRNGFCLSSFCCFPGRL